MYSLISPGTDYTRGSCISYMPALLCSPCHIHIPRPIPHIISLYTVMHIPAYSRPHSYPRCNQITISPRRDDHLVRHRAVNVHAVDCASRLARVRLHPFHLLDDHRVLARARPRREAPPRSSDLPLGERVDPQRPENFELHERLRGVPTKGRDREEKKEVSLAGLSSAG